MHIPVHFLSIRWCCVEKWLVKRGVVLILNVSSMYFLGFIGARKSEAGLWSTVEWRHFPWMACKWKDRWSVIYTIRFVWYNLHVFLFISIWFFFSKNCGSKLCKWLYMYNVFVCTWLLQVTTVSENFDNLLSTYVHVYCD